MHVDDKAQVKDIIFMLHACHIDVEKYLDTLLQQIREQIGKDSRHQECSAAPAMRE